MFGLEQETGFLWQKSGVQVRRVRQGRVESLICVRGLDLCLDLSVCILICVRGLDLSCEIGGLDLFGCSNDSDITHIKIEMD